MAEETAGSKMATTDTEQTLFPVLHHLTSSQSHRVLFMLEELNEAYGTKYELKVYARSRKGTPSGLKDHFPLGKSPILTVNENGALSKRVFQLRQHPGTLTESRLILQWLSETFGRGRWDVEDAEDKLQDTFMQEFANYSLGLKTDMILVWEIVPMMLPWGMRQTAGALVSPIVKHFKSDLPPMFQLLEDALSEERPWFSGKKMGLADFNMTWSMDKSVQRKYFDPKKYPKLAAWHERIVSRPAFKRADKKGGVYNLVDFMAQPRSERGL